MTVEIKAPGLPTTEVWMRNPANYIREMVEVPTARKVIWDRGMLAKRRIDPFAHATLYFGKVPGWEVLVCGEQGTAHLDYKHDMDNPLAVYPTWLYGEDDFDVLEEMISKPLGMDRAACSSSGAKDEIPIFGQPHRVIISNLPDMGRGLTKNLLHAIREMQEEYEHLNPLVHLHGTYSYNQMFSLGLGATDVDPRTDAAKGKIILPPGKIVKYEEAPRVSHWIGLMDMAPHELKIPRNRCIFNIKSAIWAGQYWTKDLRFKTSGTSVVDPTSTGMVSAKGAHTVLGKLKPSAGDMITCNSCSLQDKCKYFRDGAVCSVPESETSELAKYFRSRNADSIIDGLGALMSVSADRLQRGIETEEEFNELDPQVTKMINQVIGNGIKLAKLIDPSRGKTTVTVNVGDQPALKEGTPRQVTKQVVAAIMEETGLPIESITAEMVGNMMSRMARADKTSEEQKAISGTSVTVEVDDDTDE